VRYHRSKDSNRERSLGLRRSKRGQRLLGRQGDESRSVNLSRFIIIIDGSLRLEESLGLGESSEESSMRLKGIREGCLYLERGRPDMTAKHIRSQVDGVKRVEGVERMINRRIWQPLCLKRLIRSRVWRMLKEESRQDLRS